MLRYPGLFRAPREAPGANVQEVLRQPFPGSNRGTWEQQAGKITAPLSALKETGGINLDTASIFV